MVIVPDANVDLVCHGTITLFLFFDKNDRLMKHYVSVWMWTL
jgi:hypothetical protein